MLLEVSFSKLVDRINVPGIYSDDFGQFCRSFLVFFLHGESYSPVVVGVGEMWIDEGGFVVGLLGFVELFFLSEDVGQMGIKEAIFVGIVF